MFGKIWSEFQCLKGKGQNYKVWTDKVKIPVFGRIRAEFQCLKLFKIRVKIRMFGS